MKLVFEKGKGIELDLSQVSACCSNPPGDGSTCAGGTCCCTDDRVCDLCQMKEKDGC